MSIEHQLCMEGRNASVRVDQLTNTSVHGLAKAIKKLMTTTGASCY